jgi:putative CocE/NonD family hydrolase
MEDIGKYNHILPYKIQTGYIPLKDENLIAAEIISEKGSIIERPTFLQLGYRWDDKVKLLNPLIQEGFNIVRVDVRGEGGSTGTQETPWSQLELDDVNQIVLWISQQPWANGKIITFGENFSATSSELSASLNNDIIQACIATGNEYDFFSDLLFPGGLLLEWNLKAWSEHNRKYEKKTKSIQDPLYQPVLSEIKRQHQKNRDVHELFSSIQYSDDYLDPDSRIMIQEISISHHFEEICRNKIPKFCCGSWFTAKTASAVIHKFLNYSQPFIGVIGSWDNQLRQVKTLPNPNPPSLPSELALLLEYARFAKKSLSSPSSIPRLLYYFTIGEQKWKVTDIWPLPSTEILTFYINSKHTLSYNPPELKGTKSEYRVNFNATTGTTNRWRTAFGTPIIYNNRAKQNKKLISFTSSQFKNPIEITGHPVITLQMNSTHGDGAIFVYLDVIYRRKVFYLTEGQLRLIHWKETDKKPFKSPIPYRSFKKTDSSLLKPNLIYDIRIPLEPISVRLPPNSKIRVSIGGADVDNFKTYPEETKSNILWNIYHNSEFLSTLQLPIIQSEEDSIEE